MLLSWGLSRHGSTKCFEIENLQVHSLTFTWTRFILSFHSTANDGWTESTFPASSSEYASFICMCALSAQHAEQGSLFENEAPLIDTSTGADAYLAEALSLVQEQHPSVFNIEVVRSCGFLALLGLQIGNYSMVHRYLALYRGTCAQYRLHDETQWDNACYVSVCESETRRRIYWAMYRLEVHSASILGHMIRLPETQSNVSYPVGLHHPAFVPGRDGDFEDWFAGWNTTTDLYRILEHTIVDFRASRRRRTGSEMKAWSVSELDRQHRLADIQQRMLPQFTRAHGRSSDNGKNRCGFQATNILFTIHMIRIFTAPGHLQHMHGAAVALLESVHQIPPEYIRANGARLLLEMAGTGLILGTVAAKPSTSQEEANCMLELQTSLADFIETSASTNKTATNLAERLRDQIAQTRQQLIDRHDSRKESSSASVPVQDGRSNPDDFEDLLQHDPMVDETGIFSMHFRPSLLIDSRWVPT